MYGEKFGAPVFSVKTSKGKIAGISVIRGAPCGATWTAAENIKGLTLEEAEARVGLEAQFFCAADPSGWDPIHGKSPVHFAGSIHSSALNRALRNVNQ